MGRCMDGSTVPVMRTDWETDRLMMMIETRRRDSPGKGRPPVHTPRSNSNGKRLTATCSRLSNATQHRRVRRRTVHKYQNIRNPDGTKNKTEKTTIKQRRKRKKRRKQLEGVHAIPIRNQNDLRTD